MTLALLAFALVCVGAVVALWWYGPAAFRDPFPYDQPPVFDQLRRPPPDKVEHAIGGALLMLVGAALNHWHLWAPWWNVALVGGLVEVGQRFPRTPDPITGRKAGYGDYRDWLADLLGALAVAVVILLVRAVAT